MKVKMPSHIKLFSFFCLLVIFRNHLSVPAAGYYFESAYSRQPIHTICSIFFFNIHGTVHPYNIV